MVSPGSEDLQPFVGPEGSKVVYLLDAATDLEVSLLHRWLKRTTSGEPDVLRIASSRRGSGGEDHRLAEMLQDDADYYFVPARVVWMAPEKRGRRSVGWSDAFKPGDPRDPRGLRARWIRTFRPSRVKLIAARGASSRSLADDYESASEVDGVAAFTTRRAWRALDQAERKLRGNRYKIPRFVPEEILSRVEFVESVISVGEEDGISPDEALNEAEKYLREIAATHSPYVIDLIANAIHALYRQGYGKIRYRDEDLRKLAEVGSSHPVVFLPSHRSNLDRLSLQFMLWENDLPPNHTAGGINLDFFPVGPLMRRTGVFFIRRSFKDNELYKTVLRAYIDFLIEKRFPLEWYLEGGRSRSGKLLPPRLGMLHYVVDSLERGKADDIALIPVSIAYDHIQDVPDYAREAQGKTKEEESIGWLFRAVRSLRRRYGDIHIRFGDPISTQSILGSADTEGEDSRGLRKLSFEVMYRIGEATPITPTAVVSIALLSAHGKALTVEEIAGICGGLQDFIKARDLPTTETVDLGDPDLVASILTWLGEHGSVSSHEAVGRKVYWLTDEQMIHVSYYRNVVVHFFLNRALAEVAIASLIEEGSRDPDLARERMMEMRDILKFEFFFPDKDQFLVNVEEDVEIDSPSWAETLTNAGPLAVLANMDPPVAHWALLPFLDAYQIVGDELEALSGPFDEKKFLKSCLGRAKMYRIEGRLVSGESASQVLFKSALALARNRDLIDGDGDITERRAAFARDIRAARRLAAMGLDD